MGNSASNSTVNSPKHTPIVMTVAGSDSGGGAGVQADIKAISATGSFACSVIAALTAQNTQGVTGIYPIAPDFVRQQFETVYTDLDVDVVKIGMLGDVATIEVVADCLTKHKVQQIVLDPVMVAASGDLLLAPDAIDCLIEKLLPLASVITPNYLEAQALLKRTLTPGDWPEQPEDLQKMSNDLLSLGAQAVFLKAPKAVDGQMVDYFVDQRFEHQSFAAPYIDTNNTHGTGCTTASAIASYVAQGQSLPEAIASAKRYVNLAIAHSHQISIGKGRGPVHHFYEAAQA